MNQENEEIRASVYGMIYDGASPEDILEMVSMMTDEDITSFI